MGGTRFACTVVPVVKLAEVWPAFIALLHLVGSRAWNRVEIVTVLLEKEMDESCLGAFTVLELYRRKNEE